MYHELSLIVWGILHQGADGSSSHVMPAWAGAAAAIYFRPFVLKQKDQFCASRTQSRVHSNYAEAKQNQQS
jgi:hypothetical protein